VGGELNKGASGFAVVEDRPSRTATAGALSAIPRPFLRWAGSKQKLLPRLSEALPKSFGCYFEPFLGAGALFFHLQPEKAVLSDVSGELIGTWAVVRDNVDAVVKYLQPLKPDKLLYYKIRENRSNNKVTRASEFIYLNKTCWNGLYRVNAQGKFNVPYGAPRSDYIFDEMNLRGCAKLLSQEGIQIKNCDFSIAVESAEQGDLVYFDPPYVTKHNNNGFRDWNENLFSWADQERLAKEAIRLKRKGVRVIVSNADHHDIIKLYKGFKIVRFTRTSTLSSDPSFRGSVGEVILTANI
jgi:DNA adenine methylase